MGRSSPKCARPTSIWQTPYERRFSSPFDGPIIPSGAEVKYSPTSAKDHDQVHQFGPTNRPGIFTGYALTAGRSGTGGNLLIADTEDLKTRPPSDSPVKRFGSEEVDILSKMQRNIFPCRTGDILQEGQPSSTAVCKAGSCLGQQVQEHFSEEGEARDPSPDLEARKSFWSARLHIS